MKNDDLWFPGQNIIFKKVAKKIRRKFDNDGYDQNGYDRLGYNRFGYDKYGYDLYGNDEMGNNKYSNDLLEETTLVVEY